MYVLRSNISIGGKQMQGVNDVVIERSLYQIGARAVVKVPVTAVVRHNNVDTITETAKEIAVGDRVVITLGYGSRLSTEFVGYVKLLNYKTPLEIICEDEFYTSQFASLDFSGDITLEELLKACGLKVAYATKLQLSSYESRNRSVDVILKELATRYSLNIWFDLEGQVYAHGLDEVVSSVVKYMLRHNVISDDDLTYHYAEDVKLRITAKTVAEDGVEVSATVGDNSGDNKVIYFYGIKSYDELEKIAHIELLRRKYDGYSGTITTFLEPRCEPSNVADIVDEVYPSRNGRYLIESVKTRFGRYGARRDVEIGIKV